jgi:cell division inhibitor SulA
MNMPKYPDEMQGLVVKAAKMALETGNVNYVLIWLPEESENTIKNLLQTQFQNEYAKPGI